MSEDHQEKTFRKLNPIVRMEETTKEQGTHDVDQQAVEELVNIITDFQNLAVEDQVYQEKERLMEQFIFQYMKAKGANNSAAIFQQEALLPERIGALAFNLEEAKILFDKFCQWRLQIPPEFVLTELFSKKLSKSDVGESKSGASLCLSKSIAEQLICPRLADKPDPKTVLATDELGKEWNFSLHAKSTGNYVLAKDWGKYVREKGLKTGSKVTFKTNPTGDFFVRSEQ